MWSQCEMKFASSRAKRISHAKRISRSEGVFHSPQANFVEKRPTLASWSFFCQEATKKIFLSFLNKVSNSNGYFPFTVKFPLRYSIKKDLPPTRTPSSVKYSQSFGIQGLTVIPPSAATDTPTSPEITRSQKVEWL